jgi:hypothetical protein
MSAADATGANTTLDAAAIIADQQVTHDSPQPSSDAK